MKDRMLMDAWIERKIGLPPGVELTRRALEAYQLTMLRKTLRMAKAKSHLYAGRLAGVDVDRDILSLDDIEKIPFLTETDLRARGGQMLCAPMHEISRIVTLHTSGSTGEPKRVYFTEADQELTVDFFHHGMKNLTDETDLLLILLPCRRPGSVGDLLRRGLERGGTAAIPFGPLPRGDDSADADVLALIRERGVTSLVGGPVEISRLARSSPESGRTVRSVLLSTEYVSDADANAIARGWNCRVFEHYGTTESGLGGAVACYMREGYHPREADMIFEIVDPRTGRVQPDGVWGEVVLTTLTRRAMPFIRYRLGDVSRWIPSPCGCGSLLKRLDKVQARAAVKNRL
jgi:phenylacetate-coenzyme A ligase PaaK-like adenylate-forming protein